MPIFWTLSSQQPVRAASLAAANRVQRCANPYHTVSVASGTPTQRFLNLQVAVQSFEIGWNYTDGERIARPQDVTAVGPSPVTAVTLAPPQVSSTAGHFYNAAVLLSEELLSRIERVQSRWLERRPCRHEGHHTLRLQLASFLLYLRKGRGRGSQIDCKPAAGFGSSSCQSHRQQSSVDTHLTRKGMPDAPLVCGGRR